MLVRIGCGDALAAATEYVEPEAPIVEKTLRFIRYESHPWHGHRPGRYTDDAEMSAANARVLIGDFERRSWASPARIWQSSNEAASARVIPGALARCSRA